MDATGLTLIIPEKPDVERDAVAGAWSDVGGDVLRLGRFWEPPSVEAGVVRLYGNDTFCLVLQQELDLELVSPADDLILRIPTSLRGRSVDRVALCSNAAWGSGLNGCSPELVLPGIVAATTPGRGGERVAG